MPDFAEMMAQQSAQSADLQARWEDYMNQQREYFDVMQAKAEGARWTEFARYETGQGVEGAYFYAQEWQRVTNRSDEIDNAVRNGLVDAPPPQPQMYNELFTNENDDWSALGGPDNNPYNQDPMDAAQEAQDLAEGAQNAAEGAAEEAGGG